MMKTAISPPTAARAIFASDFGKYKSVACA